MVYQMIMAYYSLLPILFMVISALPHPTLCTNTFTNPANLSTTSARVIHVGVTLISLHQDQLSEGFRSDIRTLFRSLLQLSTGATQHWIILTNKNSIMEVNMVLRNIVTQHITENIIRTYIGKHKIRRVPRVIIDYINIEEIPKDENDKKFIESLQSHLAEDMEGNRKYEDKLFYLGPLYHKIFPTLGKLIFLDVGKDSWLLEGGRMCGTDGVSVSTYFAQFHF